MKKYSVIEMIPNDDGILMSSLGSHNFAEAVGIAHILIQKAVNELLEANAHWEYNPTECFVSPIEFDEVGGYHVITMKTKLHSEQEFATFMRIAIIRECKCGMNKEVSNYEG